MGDERADDADMGVSARSSTTQRKTDHRAHLLVFLH
jgi:hypothetical protein